MGRLIARSALAILPVALAVGLAASTDLLAEPEASLGCRILPNRMVPVLSSRSAGCLLRPYDRVIAARVAGEVHYVQSARGVRLHAALAGPSLDVLASRRGNEAWLSVPVIRDTKGHVIGRFAAALVLAAVLMGVSLMILWGSSDVATTPFAFFCACVSVALVSMLCGRYSDVLVIPGLVATGFVPATLGHLALTFPREREIVRRSPPVIGGIYGLSAVLTLIAAVNLNRSPDVWALADRMILLLCLVAWGLLVIGCVLAVRESKSLLERTRAKVLLGGSAIPAIPLGIGWAFGAAMPGGSLWLMTITAAVLALPIGYAISHYRLFNLALDLRRSISYVLYVAASAALISAVVVGVALAARVPLPFGDPVVLFTVAFFGFLVGDPVRAWLRGAIDSWMSPATRRMARYADEHVRRTAELLEPDDCARLLCQSVLDGLDPKGVSVFLAADDGWRLAHAGGQNPPVRVAAAEMAAKAAKGPELVYFALEDSLRDPARAGLRNLGVELVASLHSGDQSLGLALVSGSRRGGPYTTPELRFVETVVKQSAVAIHNANLARSLMISERLATQGRLGAGLIHDLGKPLGVVERLASRLPDRLGDHRRSSRDAHTIADLASRMRSTLKDFLEATRRAAAGDALGGNVDVDALVHGAVQIVARSHGQDRVSVRLEPGLPPLPQAGEKVIRALANLLDNALLASDPDDVVEVSATAKGKTLELVVIDRGRGMEASVLERAFEPFFTTRALGAGNGLGLAACRDLIEGLGGSVELASAPGRGTRARIRLPLERRGNKDVS